MALSKEKLGDNLCKYCTLERKGAYNNNGGSVAGCEGSDCDNAYDNYLEVCEGKKHNASENTLPI